MTQIDDSEYGWIKIDGTTYNHDVYILPSGKVEKREYGHTFTKEQIEHILQEKPEAVVVGQGTSGMAKLGEGARAFLEKKRVKIYEDWTPKIRDTFNELAKTKKTAAIIHVTC